jgi:hypothetical protein
MKFTNEKYPFINIIEEGRFSEISIPSNDVIFFSKMRNLNLEKSESFFKNIEYQFISFPFLDAACNHWLKLNHLLPELKPCSGCFLNNPNIGEYYWIHPFGEGKYSFGCIEVLYFHNKEVVGMSITRATDQTYTEFQTDCTLHKHFLCDPEQIGLNLIAQNLIKQFGPTEIKIFGGKDNPKKVKIGNVKMLSDLDIPIHYYDSKWFTEFHRTNGFKVRGHFRLQRCGKNLTEKKLIFIEEFQKNGYNSRAKKDLVSI